MRTFGEKYGLAFSDVHKMVEKKAVWLALGWNDVQGRYNRSKLGVFWASLSILIFVSALGPIYAQLFDIPVSDYVFHLMVGIVVWNCVSAIIMESGREYVNAVNYLVSFQLSYFTLLFRVIWRNLIVLSYQMLVFLLMALVLGLPVRIEWLIVPLALLLVIANALWMGVLMSVFATRYRDLSELMNNLFRLVFFVTPIMWMPSMKEGLELVAELNPFYHLIEIFRGPLINGVINLQSWVVALVMLVVGWLIAFPVFAQYRSRIAFWI